MYSYAWLNEPSFGGNAANTTEQALINHADETWFYDFANGWSEGESAFEQVAGSGAKLNVEYTQNTGGYVAQVLSLQGREWTYGALSAIPGFNPQDLGYRLATKLGITIDYLMPMYQNITVLKEQQHYLAEHHLYGSSRLGIKNYFPRQVYSLWDYHNGASPIIDTLNLNVRAPWWSNSLQTMINVGEVEPWNHVLNTNASAQAILGQKGYELTNHLNNVMAVVSDKRYEVDATFSGLVTNSKPSLSAAYDYYPFGMLMPGRYVQGASEACIFTTTSRWVPQWTQTYQYDWAVLSPVEYSPAVVWNPFAQNPYSSGVLSVGYPGGGLTTSLDVLPGVRQNILVPVQSNYGGPFRITATQGVGLDSFELAYQIVQGEGTYMLDFTPTAGNVRLNIIRVMSNNDGSMGYLTLLAPRRYILGYTPQNQLVQVCPTPKDPYRFGFNGQEKDNEIAGIGNHLEFAFRGFDPRVGRFWAVDPLAGSYPWNTPYAFAENDVIRCIDLEGLEKYSTIDNKPLGYGPNGNNGEIRIATAYSIAPDGSTAVVHQSSLANSERTARGRDIHDTHGMTPSGIRQLSSDDVGRILAFGTQVIRNNSNYIAPRIMTAREESVGTPQNGNYGMLDFKYVAYDLLGGQGDALMEINGTVYNANEAGNYLWGMVLQFNGILVSPAYAADKVSRDNMGRPDEPNEQKAIRAGMAFGDNVDDATMKAYDKYSGNALRRQLGANQAAADIKRVAQGKSGPGKTNQNGQPVNRQKPNRYSGN